MTLLTPIEKNCNLNDTTTTTTIIEVFRGNILDVDGIDESKIDYFKIPKGKFSPIDAKPELIRAQGPPYELYKR